MAVADDPTISDDTPLYRRISPQWLHPDSERDCVRAASGAFQTEALSVVVGDTLAAFGLQPPDVIEPWATHALVVFAAGSARAAGLTVLRDPQEPTDLDRAHALVFGKKTSARRKALCEASAWVVAPANPCETPAG